MNTKRTLNGNALVVYKQTLVLTPQQKSVLIGTLLGDACFSTKNGKAIYSIKYEQKHTQLDYVQHLYTIFEPYVGTPPKLRVICNDYHKTKPGQSYWFRTYGHNHFKYYENLFYKKKNSLRTKQVPKNIHQYLDATALAYWFMDDGSGAVSNTKNKTRHYVFDTQGFPLSDQKILVSALKRNFDLNFTVNRDKNYYKLNLAVESNGLFESLVRPHVIPSFYYKLDQTCD